MEKLKKKYEWPINKPAGILQNNHGWFHNEKKIIALQSLIDEKMTVILEIGAWLGQSTRLLLNTNKTATILSIDHWIGSNEHSTLQYPFLPVLYETFLVNCWEYKNRLIPIRENSIDGLNIVSEYGIEPNLIMIDARYFC